MSDESSIFNELYSTENPLTLLNDSNSPYSDYGPRLTETLVYKVFSKNLNIGREMSWDMHHDQMIESHMMLFYASALELFMNDGLELTFLDIFPKYCKYFYEEVNSLFFRDCFGNTIFHYDAINGMSRLKMYNKLFNAIQLKCEGKMNFLKVITAISLKNSDGITLFDIANANSAV